MAGQGLFAGFVDEGLGVEPIDEYAKDRGTCLFEFDSLVLAFDELACEGGAEVGRVVAEVVLMDLEGVPFGCWVGIGSDFDGDNWLGPARCRGQYVSGTGNGEAVHEVWRRCWVASALVLGFCLLSVVGPFLRVSGLLCCRHCDRLAELSESEKL